MNIMATQEKTWNVANRLHSLKDSDNPEVNHIIAGADEIYDDTKGAKQSTINAQTAIRLSTVESDINEPASGVKDRLTTLEGQVAFEGNIEVENNPEGIVDGSGKVASANAVRGAIDAATDVQTSNASSTDLDIADEQGNVLVRMSGGHIKTNNFDSSNIGEKITDEEMDDVLQGDDDYLTDNIGDIVNDVTGNPIATSRLQLTVEELNTLLTGRTGDNKPNTIPEIVDELDDIENIRSGASKGSTAYQKPLTGIPASDIADGVIPTIPTNVSAFNNDANYLTQHQDISGKADVSDVEDIKALIPAQATSQNKLADKDFVNSSISTATADFKGTVNSVAALDNLAADNNDYAFVVTTDNDGNTVYKRYKYNGSAWVFEYDLNNSSFTAAQWAAILSGITKALVDKLSALPTNDALTTSFDSKVDKVSGKGLSTNDYTTTEKNKLAGIAAGAEPNIQPDWNQTDSSASDFIKNKPTIPTITEKADKVTNATSGNLAGLDANGNLTDTGVAAGQVVCSTSVRTVVVLTQAQYDALTTKDANTEYNIIESV